MSHRLSELAPITLEFFEKYLSTGHLIDLYSESFLSRFESDSTTVIPYQSLNLSRLIAALALITETISMSFTLGIEPPS